MEEGYEEPKKMEDLTAPQRRTLKEHKLKDLRAKYYLFQSIDKNILKTITHKSTSKPLWDLMRMKCQGNIRVQQAQLQRLRRDFECLEMKPSEYVDDYFSRVMMAVNDTRGVGEFWRMERSFKKSCTRY